MTVGRVSPPPPARRANGGLLQFEKLLETAKGLLPNPGDVLDILASFELAVLLAVISG